MGMSDHVRGLREKVGHDHTLACRSFDG